MAIIRDLQLIPCRSASSTWTSGSHRDRAITVAVAFIRRRGRGVKEQKDPERVLHELESPACRRRFRADRRRRHGIDDRRCPDVAALQVPPGVRILNDPGRPSSRGGADGEEVVAPAATAAVMRNPSPHGAQAEGRGRAGRDAKKAAATKRRPRREVRSRSRVAQWWWAGQSRTEYQETRTTWASACSIIWPHRLPRAGSVTIDASAREVRGEPVKLINQSFMNVTAGRGFGPCAVIRDPADSSSSTTTSTCRWAPFGAHEAATVGNGVRSVIEAVGTRTSAA